ncbi:response regulator transcription factor [Amycolatopsis sp. NPDC051758]|uniref:response regulator transcription factor n=1 Tax=Amycolatopsis sp. NPDC051758 TaxID=3363935 RepID=UPI0037ABBE4A
MLDAAPDIEVIAEAADGGAVVRLARWLRPVVTLMDIRMPEVDGLRATEMLAGAAVAEPLRVVVVTTYDADENVYTEFDSRRVQVPAQVRGPADAGGRSARGPEAKR